MTEPIVDDESPHLSPKNASPKRSPSPKRSSPERQSPSPNRRSPSPKRSSPERLSPSPKRRSPSPKRSSPERRTSKRISSSPKRRSPSPKRLPDTQSFQYDTYVDLTGEGGSFATAAQLATLEKRNKALMSSIEKLEDKLYESEDRRLVVQRKLLIAEEESADYRTLLDQIESQNAQIRKELDQLGVKFQNENSRFNEVDNENHKLENKAALIKSEVEVNSRAQSKLEQALAEIENLRQKLVSMLKEKEEIDMTVAQREKEVSELEKRLYSESLRSREINTRTVTNLESLIESERNRAQQAIDYVRQTLKAKIRVLEAQIETDTESDTKIKKEKREVARQLKLVKRKLDEKRSEVGRDKRRIETLSKQVDALKERLEKVTIDSSDLEQRHHALKREVGTLSIQLDAAHYTNAKLNVLIPNNVRLAIEEEAIVETGKKEIPLETYSKKSQAELTDDNLFDTSVNLDTTSKPITSDD